MKDFLRFICKICSSIVRGLGMMMAVFAGLFGWACLFWAIVAIRDFIMSSDIKNVEVFIFSAGALIICLLLSIGCGQFADKLDDMYSDMTDSSTYSSGNTHSSGNIEGGWRCKHCGNVNAVYVGTCGCGWDKSGNTYSRSGYHSQLEETETCSRTYSSVGYHSSLKSPKQERTFTQGGPTGCGIGGSFCGCGSGI